MKPVNKNTLFLPLLLSITLLLNACNSTNLVKNWSDPEYKGPALKNILIIGVIKNDKKRRSFENEFAELITEKGRSGTASYTLLPDLEQSNTKQKVLDIVKKIGADGVMIVTTHGVSEQQWVTPPSLDYVGGAGIGYGHGMYGYYNTSHSIIFNQGYTVTNTILRIDVKLFDVATEKVIWAGKTESDNPTSAEQVIKEFEKLVIRDMQSSGVIK
jgi:hypothetical protein